MNAIEFAASNYLTLIPVGSRVTCNPPPTDTDRDYLVYTHSGAAAVMDSLVAGGWEVCRPGDYADMGHDAWAAYRKGEDNLILTWSRAWYDCFLASTEVAKALNLLRKEDRITLFATMRKEWPGFAGGGQVLDELFA